MKQRVKYLGQRSFCSEVIVHTHTPDRSLYLGHLVVGDYQSVSDDDNDDGVCRVLDVSRVFRRQRRATQRSLLQRDV